MKDELCSLFSSSSVLLTLVDTISKHGLHDHLYADDSQIYGFSRSDDTAVQHLRTISISMAQDITGFFEPAEELGSQGTGLVGQIGDQAAGQVEQIGDQAAGQVEQIEGQATGQVEQVVSEAPSAFDRFLGKLIEDTVEQGKQLVVKAIDAVGKTAGAAVRG